MDAHTHNNEYTMKVAGKRKAPLSSLSTERDTAHAAKAWRKAFPTPFVPRGVYRFVTHEQADKWLMEMITRRRKTAH
jgi:hypothetical protein